MKCSVVVAVSADYLNSDAATALAITAALAGCAAPATTSTSSSSAPAAASSAAPAAATYTGTFAGLNDKKVTGKVTINGSTVTLSGFSSDEGPDLHLYLTNGTTEADVTSGTEFSKVAFDAASQTFTLPAGVDASAFTTLVVHCDKALAVFGAAALSK